MTEKLTLRTLEDRMVDALASHAQEIDALEQEVAAANKRLAVVEQHFAALLSGFEHMTNELEARVRALEARPVSRSAARVIVDPARAAAIRAFAPGYARAHKGCTYEEAEAAYDAAQQAAAAA